MLKREQRGSGSFAYILWCGSPILLVPGLFPVNRWGEAQSEQFHATRKRFLR
jgi:hypothetical protein